MDLSIIIVNYKSEEFLRNCLKSILRNISGCSFEIIVIDNEANGKAKEMIEKQFPKVKILENKENLGFGKANNQGAKVARGNILLFLNPDILIKKNIFHEIINTFNSDKNIGIISPELVLANASPQLWSCGKRENFYQLIKSKFFSKPDTSNLSKEQIKVEWVSGAALAIKKKIFKQINGFDEKFFMYFEDRDLCRRVGNLGYKTMVLLKLKVIHLGGQAPILNKRRKKIYYQSQNYYWRKHYGLLKSLLMRLIRWPYKFYILNIKK